MPTKSESTVFLFMPFHFAGHTNTWFKTTLPVIRGEREHRDGTPAQRLLDILPAFAASVIVDSIGYFIKKQPSNMFGDHVIRVFSEGMQWLEQNSVSISRDALLSELQVVSTPNNRQKTIKSTSSSDAYNSKAFTDFLAIILPKGVPSALG